MQSRSRDWTWAYHRVRAMSAGELPYRVWQIVRVRRRRRSARTRRTADRLPIRFVDGNHQPETFLARLRERGSPRFFFDVNPWVEAGDTCAGQRPEVTCERSQRVLAGEIDLGTSVLRNMPPNWHADPVSGVEWPMSFHADIGVRDREEIGDVRAVWEVNRQQWLFDVACDYSLTGDDCYAEFIERVVADWIAQNPIDLGVNWKSAMEAAIRAQTWIWLAFLVCRSERPRLSVVLAHGIWSHLTYVEGNLSRFSSANNHLMVEAVTLFIAGVLFPEFEDSQRWRRMGEQLITQEIRSQTRQDGVCAEQSIHYHAFVLEALLLMVILAERNAISLDPFVLDRIRGMLRFLYEVTDENGEVPAIGDSDDGRVSPLSRREESYYTYVLTLGRALGGDPVQRGSISERALWLVGGDPVGAVAEPVNCRDSLSMAVFPDSGYVVIRHEATLDRLVFDSGPHGLEKLCAHAHADALSVTLSVRGIDVLIDPGTYVYNTRREERDAFRSTEAHNTVVVDGRSQSVPAGPFLWSSKTDAVLQHWTSGAWFAFAAGFHNGYRPVRHIRMVLVVAHDLWVFVDIMNGDGGTHTYVHNLNLGEEICSRPISGGWVLEHGVDPIATVLQSSWPGLSHEARPARASRRFLEVHPIEQLTTRVEVAGEFRLITVCYTGHLTPILKERGEGVLHIEYGGRSQYLVSGKYSSDDVRFEGDLLYLACTDEGKLERSFAHGCRHLSYRGQNLGDLAEGTCKQLVVE